VKNGWMTQNEFYGLYPMALHIPFSALVTNGVILTRMPNPLEGETVVIGGSRRSITALVKVTDEEQLRATLVSLSLANE
jgi:hypothetical protein